MSETPYKQPTASDYKKATTPDYPDYRPPNIAEQMEDIRKQGSHGSEYNFEAGFKAIAEAEYAKMAPIVEKLESIDKRLESIDITLKEIANRIH